ncbi:UvaF, partial [Enterococcus faecalis]
MKQNRKEFSSYFSRSIKQNKPLYLLLVSSETNPFPRPVIGTFRGYAEENKIIIGEDSYSIEEVDFVCMYRHSSRIKQEERVNSNPFQGL